MMRNDNKSLNMLNNEDGCIRYLMREMDPAEEIEFEREMLNDENLLIEVESLRRTYQKIGKLPIHVPPKSLIDQVTHKAVIEQRKRTERTKILFLNFAKAVASVAAALMIVFTAIYFYGAIEEQPIDNTSTIQTTAETEIHPWVDRNEVIQFVGTTNQPQLPSALDDDVEQSFGRLKLVNSETGFSAPNQRVILTSTSQ